MKAHQRIVRENIAKKEAASNLFGSYWQDKVIFLNGSVLGEILQTVINQCKSWIEEEANCLNI